MEMLDKEKLNKVVSESSEERIQRSSRSLLILIQTV